MLVPQSYAYNASELTNSAGRLSRQHCTQDTETVTKELTSMGLAIEPN